MYYYKMQGTNAPKTGNIYTECYYHNSYMYFKYLKENKIEKALEPISENEYYLHRPDYISVEPQPTNADILAALQRSQEELKQEAIDSYTMELMEQGIL